LWSSSSTEVTPPTVGNFTTVTRQEIGSAAILFNTGQMLFGLVLVALLVGFVSYQIGKASGRSKRDLPAKRFCIDCGLPIATVV
jgi:hypothetical protein